MRFLFLLLLFSFLSIAGDTALIASFNSLKLGKNQKDYYQFSKVISKFDLIGLEEVMDKNVMKIIKKNLENITNSKWDYHVSEYPVGSSEYKEYYAYIWRREKVSMEKVIGFYKEKTPNDFIREPYGVKFKIGKFDFIYVLAHSIFGKRERERILEAARYILVYEYFLESDPLENDIIIAGDFNLPANNMGFRKLLKHENEVEFILDPENDLTTLGKNSLASAYDNFFISKKHTKEFTGKYGVYNYIKNNYDDIRKYISDNIPIFIEVDISMDKF